jgi:proliferating cell nuclear antigen PCNA
MNISLNNLTKVDIFATLFQNIKLFTDQINIDCNEERMYIQTMDNSKVSILEITIPSTWFCSYHCPNPIVIGINSSIFFKILSSRDKVQTMQIIFSIEDEDKLFVHMNSSIKTVFDRNFEVPLIDLCSDIMTIPIIEYQADISLPSLDFALLINQLKGFGETLEFVCNENKIEMISKSIDQGKMSVSVGIDDLSSFAIEEGRELNMSYSLNNLHSMCCYSKICKEVEIKMHESYPLYVGYFNEELLIKFFLAPKISDD